MRAFPASIVFGLTSFALAGCSTPPRSPGPVIPPLAAILAPTVVQAGYCADDKKENNDEELPPPEEARQ